MFGSEKEAAAYLAGIIDGEGSIDPGQRKQIRVRVTDREIIEACIEAANLLGLTYSVYWDIKQNQNPNYADYHELAFSRQNNLRRMRRLIPIQSKSKRKKLEILLSSYKREPWGNHISFEEKQIIDSLKSK